MKKLSILLPALLALISCAKTTRTCGNITAVDSANNAVTISVHYNDGIDTILTYNNVPKSAYKIGNKFCKND